jgi:diguanylate cyclase (GGDEF)-like protein
VTVSVLGDRRAISTPRATARPGRLRRLLSAVRVGLCRPLADDDDRAAYWVRHVKYGILQTEIAAAAILVYSFLTPSQARHHPVILVLGPLVMLAAPTMLLLPLKAMMRDNRGPAFMYAWSCSTVVLITIVARIDGGASSPLFSVLFLTLAFMAVAYSPYGVVAMGALMTGSYLIFVALPDLTHYALFFATVMASFTLICAMASSNAWASYDRQVTLIRTHEMLASTDPLTGIPNRRAFLDRLAGAVGAAAWGHRSVVCLVDLDGFKAVNDAGGHAAGDLMLQTVASALGVAVRETDTVARLGGDEFAVLADITGGVTGEMLADRLRLAVATVGTARGVTASVGVAEIEAGDDVEDLMHRADAAMYRSKTAGGNRVTTLAY